MMTADECREFCKFHQELDDVVKSEQVWGWLIRFSSEYPEATRTDQIAFAKKAQEIADKITDGTYAFARYDSNGCFCVTMAPGFWHGKKVNEVWNQLPESDKQYIAKKCGWVNKKEELTPTGKKISTSSWESLSSGAQNIIRTRLA